MAWSFSTKPARAQKSAVQLQREAALVLAMGGGFQAYFQQRRDGIVPMPMTVNIWNLRFLEAEAADLSGQKPLLAAKLRQWKGK